MGSAQRSDSPKLAVFRFWWLYVLLALGNLGLAGYHAANRDPGWVSNVAAWTALGLCFLLLGLVFRHEGRRKRNLARQRHGQAD